MLFKNILKSKRFLLLILGLFFFGLIIVYNKEFSLESFYSLNYYFLVLAFITHLILESLTTHRWQLMVDSFSGQKIMPFYEYFFYLTLSYTAGLLGFNEATSAIVRAGALKISRQVSIYKSFNSVIAEKYFDLINLNDKLTTEDKIYLSSYGCSN